MRITLFTNYYAISGVDVKYIFDLETLEGIKEYIDYQDGEVKTDIITDKDRGIIQLELKNIEFQQKIEQAKKKNKKSIKLSMFRSPEKQFQEKLEGVRAKLESDLLNMLFEIDREIQYPFQYDNLLIIKDKINNNKFFRVRITAEQLQLLESKIEQAKQVKKEFEYKHEVIFSIKQNNNNNIFYYVDSSGYYYLVTQRRYKTKTVIKLFRELLTQEGYIITDDELTLLYYNIYRGTKDIEITRIELERMRQGKQMPYIVYQEIGGRILKKIFDPLLISENYNDIITVK